MKKWRQNSGPMPPLLGLTPSSPWVSSSLATILWERGQGRSGSTQCAPSYARSRQPPHAFLDQVLASHCLLGFYGKEVSFKFSLWPHVKGNRSRFLPLFHDWILLTHASRRPKCQEVPSLPPQSCLCSFWGKEIYSVSWSWKRSWKLGWEHRSTHKEH